MMTFFNSCLISCGAIIGLMGANTAPPNISDVDRFSLVNLQNNMTLSTSFSSEGCFHSNAGKMTFTSDTMTFDGKTKTVSLTDMTKLDNYLRTLALKQGSFGGCTTATSFTLTLNQGGNAVGQMNLFDDFCLSGNDMISPDRLRYKLFEQETAEQITLKPEE